MYATHVYHMKYDLYSYLYNIIYIPYLCIYAVCTQFLKPIRDNVKGNIIPDTKSHNSGHVPKPDYDQRPPPLPLNIPTTPLYVEERARATSVPYHRSTSRTLSRQLSSHTRSLSHAMVKLPPVSTEEVEERYPVSEGDLKRTYTKDNGSSRDIDFYK